jgi:hypothetical protein
MISTRYCDKSRSDDAIMEHFCMMHRHRVVVRTGDSSTRLQTAERSTIVRQNARTCMGHKKRVLRRSKIKRSNVAEGAKIARVSMLVLFPFFAL